MVEGVIFRVGTFHLDLARCSSCLSLILFGLKWKMKRKRRRTIKRKGKSKGKSTLDWRVLKLRKPLAESFALCEKN